LRWLAEEVSPDTYVNIMGQYHPDYQVGQISDSGAEGQAEQYAEINRLPAPEEMAAAYQAAREAGLWRFDEGKLALMM
jgi:putative pyruvate formate lyase activating enzyme